MSGRNIAGIAERGPTPAVLLLVFRRPEQTCRMFECVRRARPRRLYVAGDGPRPDRPQEVALCDEARRIATTVDWPCTVQTLFRNENLGCRVGVSTALDWFFEHECEGIVLEDDCVASDSFFPFCAQLLERYRHDERIMCISGDNFQRSRSVTRYSYYFSRYMHCWGWATWRRAWSLYDRDMALWPEFRDSGGLNAWADGDQSFVRYWRDIFDAAAAGKIDSWAYRFLFTCWAHHGLTVLPVRNLVSNIGLGKDATHTSNGDSSLFGLAADELDMPLDHPQFVARNMDADHFEQHAIYDLTRRGGASHVLRAALRNTLPPPVLNSLRRLRAEMQW